MLTNCRVYSYYISMPKKKSSSKKIPHHFLWSIFFLAVTVISYIYALWMGSVNNISSTWIWGALISSSIALALVLHEKSTGKLGKGEFLWSIFFTTLTLAFSIYLAINFPIFITVVPLVSTFITLFLLVHEKYYY